MNKCISLLLSGLLVIPTALANDHEDQLEVKLEAAILARIWPRPSMTTVSPRKCEWYGSVQAGVANPRNEPTWEA